MTPTIVRRAVQDDIPWLLQQLGAFSESLGYKNSYLPPPARLAGLLSILISEHVVLLAESGDIDSFPIGCIGGEFTLHPISQLQVVLYEHFWWVAPPYRQSGAGAELLASFVAAGKSRNAPVIVSTEHNTPPGVVSCLLANGFRHAESTYILE